MSNEELAVKVQQGEQELTGELWEQVERFISYMANKRLMRLPEGAAVEFDDLYNAGYLAFIDALRLYNEGQGAFITILGMTLKTAFANATGYRSKRQRLDPLHRATSLDAPLNGEDDLTLTDTIADPAEPYADAEERIFRRQLHNEMEKALATLDSPQEAVIRARFYQGKTLGQIAEEQGKSRETVRAAEGKALKNLRNPRVSRKLREFIEDRTPYYLRVGVTRFNTTGSSAVEELAIMRENWIEKWEGVNAYQRT